MIELHNVGVYRDRWIFRNISLKIIEGETIGLIGKSGVGKSTLLKAICGLVPLKEGKVRFRGKDLLGPDQKLIPGYEEIRLVDQEFALDLYHTVEENIREVLLFLPKSERDSVVQELLELSELEEIKSLKAHLISGGEKQRLALVRALAMEPAILALDEPFVHLDSRLKQKFMAFIRAKQEQNGMTVIMASHDGAELMGFVDEIIYLRNGVIARKEQASELFYNSIDLEEAQLLGLINELQINGKTVLFRPNEYRIESPGSITLKVKRSNDNGLVYWNTCEVLSNGELIQLVSVEPLQGEFSISIHKRS
jgi:iron(III) transport system ATP-binding protein